MFGYPGWQILLLMLHALSVCSKTSIWQNMKLGCAACSDLPHNDQISPYIHFSLIPKPSHCPVFDCSHCKKNTVRKLRLGSIYHTCDVNVYLAKPREEAACDQKNFIPKQADTFHFMSICGSSAWIDSARRGFKIGHRPLPLCLPWLIKFSSFCLCSCILVTIIKVPAIQVV